MKDIKNYYRNLHFAYIIFFALLLLLASGCSGSRKPVNKSVNQEVGITEKTYKGPVEVTVAVNKKRITLADSLEYLLTIKCENGYNAQLPEFNEKLFGGLAVKDRITFAKEYPDTQTVVLKEKYLLDPFLSGVYTIAPLEIKFYSETDTQIYSVESKSIEITVDSLTDTTGQIPAFRDATAPVELKRNYKKLTAIIIVAIIVILIIAGGYYIWRKRKLKNKIITVILPADEIAYIKLRELINMKLVEQNQIKEFYFRLSLILREYLENRFALRAQE